MNNKVIEIAICLYPNGEAEWLSLYPKAGGPKGSPRWYGEDVLRLECAVEIDDEGRVIRYAKEGVQSECINGCMISCKARLHGVPSECPDPSKAPK